MRIDLLLQQDAISKDKPAEYEALKKLYSGKFEKNYQKWYSESCALLAQLLPDRLDEFTGYYLANPKRREVTLLNFTLQDWLLGIRASENWRTGKKFFEDLPIASSKFTSQKGILESAERRFESSLFDIQQLLRADLFDSELEAAKELLKHKFLRGSGAIAGVVLEKHLSAVCSAHQIVLKKTHPTISTFNDALKDAAVIDIPTWRFIQHLGDLRNLCDHGKAKEPSEAEIADLIDGTAKITKTVA
ncbi:MAG: hypothetical protein HZA31_06325 [Opitutae bacterium]|nr:hypothetical protein [Opitutae bacterium]